tara:strand:- start:1794 stop:2234 length:441 start_codon:yes stop_codon:yes gene_type:complete
MYPIVRRSAAPTTRSLFDGFLDDDWGFAPIFNAFLSDAFTDNNRTLSSVRANVTTNENDHRVDIVVPGLEKDDIIVDINDDTLTVSYEAKETESKLVSYRSFRRTWSLPQSTNASDISAKYNQGILSITVPKNEPEIPVSHRIEVK